MKSWQVSAPKTMIEGDFSEEITSVSSAKVKITKALLNRSDVFSCLEPENVSTNIPGSFGVGVITEASEHCFGMEKNARVYINPFTYCNGCPRCKESDFANCPDVKAAGKDFPGFLREFGVFPASQLYVLPESVDETAAVFIDYIALALRVIDTLDINKGDHVAVLGGKTLGNILCQLIMYYQGVPILIDSDEENVELCKQLGVYYTAEAGYTAAKQISAITSGRMADKAVYTCDPKVDPKLAFQLVGHGSKIAFAGFDFGPIRLNFNTAMEKQLIVYALTNGIGNISSAINLLANKAVNVKEIAKRSAEFFAVGNVLKEQAEKVEREEKILPVIVNLMN